MRSLLLPLLLLPSLAAAQTTPTLTLDFGAIPNQNVTSDGKTLTVGTSDCGTDSAIRWSVNVLEVCDSVKVWLQPFAETCGTAPTANSLTVVDRTATEVRDTPALTDVTDSAHGATATVDIDELLATVAPTTGGARNACGADVQETRQFRICGFTKSGSGLTAPCQTVQDLKSTPSDLQLVYDHEKPAPPVPTVTGLDGRIRVTVPPADDIDTVRIQLRSETQSEFRDVASGPVAEQFEITAVENDTTYFVRVFQTDLAGNESDASPESAVTPAEVFDFYERYQAAGGTETGGCGAAGGAGLTAGAALAVLGLWLAASRRRA